MSAFFTPIAVRGAMGHHPAIIVRGGKNDPPEKILVSHRHEFVKARDAYDLAKTTLESLLIPVFLGLEELQYKEDKGYLDK